MNTREIIEALREADPDGGREVWLEITNQRSDQAVHTWTDVAGSVRVDEADDVVIAGEQQE